MTIKQYFVPEALWDQVIAIEATAGQRVAPQKAGTYRAIAGMLAPGTLSIADHFARPFHERSVWNRPLAQAPSKSYQALSVFAGFDIGLGNWFGTAVPVFRAMQTDREVRVLHADTWWNVSQGTWKQTANTAAQETAIRATARNAFPFPYHPYLTKTANASGGLRVLPAVYDQRTDPVVLPLKIRTPSGVHPTVNPDGHMVVFQPDGRIFECFGAIVLGNGDIVCTTYKMLDPALGGDGWQNGVRASMVPVTAGLIRKHEVAAGVIPHALAAVVGAQALKVNALVAPALALDKGALSERPPYSGPLPMGTRLALPPGTVIAALRLAHPLSPMIATAMRDYGIILVDRGGSNGLTLIPQHGVVGLDWTQAFSTDLAVLLAQLRQVTTASADYFVSG